MNRSISFDIKELVPKKVYDLRGEKAWELIDRDLIKAIDLIKERFPMGTMTINNWMWGGDREYSGLRTPDSEHYSPTSQHALGKAVDAVFSSYNVLDVRQDIIDNPDIYYMITGIELDVSWLHIDVRNYCGVKTFKA